LAAIVNAINDALSEKLGTTLEMPMAPEKIWRARLAWQVEHAVRGIRPVVVDGLAGLETIKTIGNIEMRHLGHWYRSSSATAVRKGWKR
jgi:hypothetical protein